MRAAPAAGRGRWSKKVLVGSTALGVVALGTGVSLAATQGSDQPESVTCIVLADGKAAADANSALSDVFAVGTRLHLTSAGRAVDVTVSGPLTAAPPSASASASADPSASASTSASADPSASASASASADPSASASASGGTGTGQPGRHHRRHHRPSASPAPTVTAPAAAVKAAQAGRNGGVDPNTVCVELSKNAFNTLGNSGNGNNVGAFIATMTPEAADPASSQ
jgi:hypothetical protein